MATNYQGFDNDTFLPPDQPLTLSESQAPAGSSTSKTDPNQVSAWYQQYLGRAPESQSVVDAWAGQDPATAQAGIQNSAEGQAYAAANPPGRVKLDNPAVPQSPIATTAPAAAPVFGASATGVAATPANPQFQGLIDTLLARANQDPNVDPNDPAVSAATDAYSADQTRAGRQFLTAAAEKAGPYGSIGAETAHAAETTGRQSADYRANLVNTLRTQRMASIESALTGAEGMLSGQQQSSLQAEYLALQKEQQSSNETQQSWDDQYKSIFG